MDDKEELGSPQDPNTIDINKTICNKFFESGVLGMLMCDALEVLLVIGL